MAHHKSTATKDIITVRDANNTYTARWDGEKASSTAGPEQAARACAAKMLGLPASSLRPVSVQGCRVKPTIINFSVMRHTENRDA